MKRKWIFAGLALAALVIGTLTAAEARSWSFGFSPRGFLGEAIGAGVFGSPILVAGVLVLLWHGKEKQADARALGMIVAGILILSLLSASLAEIWCGVEEYCFRREVARSGEDQHDRPRWFPYESSGLVYDNGTFGAHD